MYRSLLGHSQLYDDDYECGIFLCVLRVRINVNFALHIYLPETVQIHII